MVLVPSAETRRRQALASDPRFSAFVSANAGSGKTHVLVERVIRLLLDGVAPDRILCLTFTRAAAAQMQAKVAQQLGAWATLDDFGLALQIAEMIGERPSERRLASARRLFAEALETPGGLKIQTIHAFCERLVQQFPFEANVPAGFQVLDERDAAALRTAAKRSVLSHLAAGGKLAGAMADILAENCDGGLDRALDAVLAAAGDFRKLYAEPSTGSAEKAASVLRRCLGLEDGETAESIDAELLADGLLARNWEEVARWLDGGGKTDKKNALLLRAAASGDQDRGLETYLCLFKKSDGEARAQGFGSKGLREARPDLAALVDAEHQRMLGLLERRRTASAFRRTAALYRLAEPLLQTYATSKAQRGALDFDDLIAKTLALLSRSDAAWVLFKLDGGIEHLLIDEAQDTSPDAWRIVDLLVEEFTAGKGQREVRRTLFAVGDEKQSIYSFQGAVPAEFGRMKQAFERRHRDAGLPFESIPLTQSFRSTASVLAAVDHVFKPAAAHAGLESLTPRPTVHETARPGAPGVVELWPLMTPDPDEEGEPLAWDAPFDRPRSSSAVVKLANRISVAVGEWIEEGVAPGEILILVRQRAAVFESVLRALKARGLPVAGADRLVINDHIAVLDMMALGDALSTPDDDLSLAAVLKSPLFGFDDDDLMQIAPSRSGRLRDALAERAGTERQRAAVAQLADWENKARTLSPFAFYSSVLAASDMRRAFRRRLGAEADDALDAFLEAAETFGAHHPPTLPGFLAWLRAARTEIKRDLDVGASDVRVMTVHGAKGLEASLVVLADSCGEPRARNAAPVLLRLARPEAPAATPPLPVWVTRKHEDPPSLVAVREEAWMRVEEEYRRLMYVALTRAKDRLIIAGHKGKKKTPDGCWYQHVRAGLEAEATAIPVTWAAEPILRLCDGVPTPHASSGGKIAPAPPPAWFRKDAPHEAPPGTPLAPSLLGTVAPRGFRLPGSADGRARGVLLHRLLASLPGVPLHRRAETARRIAELSALLPEDGREEAVRAALAILEHGDFAQLFVQGGRIEVPIRGRLPAADGQGRAVSGRIDRLVVTATEVLILDYKTDAAVPAVPEAAPARYVAQLAAYRAIIAGLYPGRRVQCGLLWTQVPRLDTLPDRLLDAALRELCAGDNTGTAPAEALDVAGLPA